MTKKLYRQFQGFVKTLAEIQGTVKSTNAMLDKWNKESYAFWTEFNKDFPEMKLDISKLKTHSEQL